MDSSTASDMLTRPVKLLLTEAEAAEALGISPRALWDLRKSGEIRVVKIGRCIRYSYEELRDWIARNLTTDARGQ